MSRCSSWCMDWIQSGSIIPFAIRGSIRLLIGDGRLGDAPREVRDPWWLVRQPLAKHLSRLLWAHRARHVNLRVSPIHEECALGVCAFGPRRGAQKRRAFGHLGVVV
jgi:hypothetical protein